MQRIRYDRPCPECGKILATGRSLNRHAGKIHGLTWEDLMVDRTAARRVAPQIAEIFFGIRRTATEAGGKA